jgi:hypothetical protein
MRTGSIAHLAMDREVLNQYIFAHALYMIIKPTLDSFTVCFQFLARSKKQVKVKGDVVSKTIYEN